MSQADSKVISMESCQLPSNMSELGHKSGKNEDIKDDSISNENKYNIPMKVSFRELIGSLVSTLTPPANDKNLQLKIENGYKYYKEKEIFDCVSEWMLHYNGNDWKKFLQLDREVYKINPNFDSYTRHLVANKKNIFRLMVLCWPSKIESPIHDHGGSECWLRVISGHLEEQFYEIPQSDDEPLKLKFKKLHGPGAVCFINDDCGLHRIVNTSNVQAVSLHCYVPGYDKCHTFLDENCVKNGKNQCLMSYSSVGGKSLCTKH